MLAAATDHALAHGLSGLKLRPLAAALGTSPRMLLYDFGTKEALLGEVLAEGRRRQVASLADAGLDGAAPRDALRAAWRWFIDHLPYVQLLFEVYVDSLAKPAAYAGRRELVEDWITYMAGAFGTDDVGATLVLALIRGLALDRLTAPNGELTDRALDRFADLLRS